MSTGYVTKGSHIRADWFGDAKPVALSGMQMKVQATRFIVTGIVRHVRTDSPANPTPDNTEFWIDPDPGYTGPTVDIGCSCGHPHVRIKPAHGMVTP